MTTTNQTEFPETRSVEEILADLDFWTGRSKIHLVQEAGESREAISPHLLAHLEEVLADPEGYLNEDHDLLPYALVLLAYFREERAHPLMLSFFSLADDLTFDLVGDMRTTALPAFLLRTCGGSLVGIKTLVLNRAADDYVRWAAMETLCLAVISGLADREEIILFLSGLMTGDEAERGSHFWSGVVYSLCDLYPADVMEVVRKGYVDGLILPRVIRLEDFEKTLADGLEETLNGLKRDLEWRIPDEIERLVALCEDFDGLPAPKPGARLPNPGKKKTLNKNKKKIAKASRRRNR
jgi:hypothetical protein